MKKLLLVPYVFVVMNWAPIVGLYHFLRKGAGENLWLEYKLDPWVVPGDGRE